jgi:hypothetical protein
MDPTIAPDDLKLVAAALVAFQAEVSDPEKTKTATVQPKDKSKQAYSYGYAGLPEVLETVRPLLTKNGLCVLQDVTTDEKSVAVTTTILHASGQFLTFGPLILHAEGEPKNWGSSITYARRFAIKAALNIADAGDDEARSAGKGSRGGGSGKASAAQIALIKGEAFERAEVNEAQLRVDLRTTYKLTVPDDLPIDKALALLPKAGASDMIERLKAETQRVQEAKAAGADPVTGEVAPPADAGEDDATDYWPDGEPEAPPGMDAEGFKAQREATAESALPAPDGRLV